MKLSLFRSNPTQVFSKKANSQENNNAEAQSVEHPQNALLREKTSGELLLHAKRTLKGLIYKKFLFTIVKLNLLTLKMNKNKQINKNKNNKYPVIVSRSFKRALRFFHWVLQVIKV